MEVKAYAKFIRLAPRKARLIVDVVRGKDVQQALQILSFMPKKGAKFVFKVVASAAANAEHNFSLQKNNLFIKQILVGDGPTLDRWMPRAFGRATPIRKRTSHISVVLDEKIPSAAGSVKRIAKPPASSMTIRASQAHEEPVSSTVSKKAGVADDIATDKAPEPFDVHAQGKHRHAEAQEKKGKKPQAGFLKKMFRRKAGE
jgi:large subunit ribosomal protein L22